MITHKSVVICDNCKCYWITPITKCDKCNHSTFTPTHESNKYVAENYNKKAVVALIYSPDGTQVLAVSRKYDKTLFGLPGGKVDPGETWEQALIREIFEETGLSITKITWLWDREDKGEFDEYYAKVYHCEVEDFNIRPDLEHGETGIVKFVDWTVLFEGPFADYNKALYNILKERNLLFGSAIDRPATEEQINYIKFWLQCFGKRDNETFYWDIKYDDIDWHIAMQYNYDDEGNVLEPYNFFYKSHSMKSANISLDGLEYFDAERIILYLKYIKTKH